MKIFKPKTISSGDSCVLAVEFTTKKKRSTLWYEFPIEYKDFLVYESADAFVLALLPLAMRNKEDIYLTFQISARLNYTLNSYLILLLNLYDPHYNLIKVIAEKTTNESLNIKSCSATGVSCGVDSLSTILSHREIQTEYKLDYLVYFNAGSHGKFQGVLAEKTYRKRLNNAKNFAKKIELPILTIKTNLPEILGERFQKFHTLMHLSCVLNLQKLFANFHYASAFNFDYFSLTDHDTAGIDQYILNFVCTESTSFFSTMSNLSRLERTKYITKHPDSFSHLDVCTNSLSSNKLNCSKCEKCMRTLLSLEVLNKLNEYEAVFDLNIFHKNKNEYIGRLIFNRLWHKDSDLLKKINSELLYQLKKNGRIKIRHFLIVFVISIKTGVKSIRKRLKLMWCLWWILAMPNGIVENDKNHPIEVIHRWKIAIKT